MKSERRAFPQNTRVHQLGQRILLAHLSSSRLYSACTVLESLGYTIHEASSYKDVESDLGIFSYFKYIFVHEGIAENSTGVERLQECAKEKSSEATFVLFHSPPMHLIPMTGVAQYEWPLSEELSEVRDHFATIINELQCEQAELKPL